VPRIAYKLNLAEVTFSAMRAQGAGGQNVNKVSSAIMLRFDVLASTLPPLLKSRLLATNDQRLTVDGVMVIKAQEHRSQPMNRSAAVERLVEALDAAAYIPVNRVATKPTRASKVRRVEGKVLRGRVKALRSTKVSD
jgi:ribosome-associated protein